MKKLILLPLLFLSFAQASQTILCESIEILTGDTIYCVPENGNTLQISLSGIKAPKMGQPYGEESKNLLSELMQLGGIDNAHKISIVVLSQNNTRTTATGMVYREYLPPNCPPPLMCEPISPTPVSRTLLEKGLAWYKPDNIREDNFIPREAELEKGAREAKRRLWADDNPTPPWEWSKEKSSSNSKYINICGHFPTKLNPDGCRPMKRKSFERINENWMLSYEKMTQDAIR